MYTIQERKAIYQLSLKFLNGEIDPSNYVDSYNDWAINNSGLCELIREACFDLKYTTLDNDISISEFPEFAKHYPEKPYESGNGFWWPKEDRQIRRQVLEECIKMTENEDRTN